MPNPQQQPARIAILGTTGSGKTTLSQSLSRLLQIPAVELDAIRHGPNWVETPDDEFCRRIAAALHGENWVVDGNYSVARDIIWPRATTLIWLDYSFPLVFWRLFRRTMRRGILRAPLWNGNKEDLWRHFLTTDSLFLWAVKTHWKRRRTLSEALASPDYAHIQILHFKSAKQTARWLETVSRAKSP